MLAALFLDALWPVFLLLGIEHVRIEPGNTAFTPLAFERYPISHSLFMALVWAVLFAAFYRSRTGYTTGAFWIGVGVVSHWVLDFVTHRPDLPLLPFGSTRAGLGLWNHPMATIVVESAMFGFGVCIYILCTRARNRTGQLALWALVLLLAVLYAADVTSPPPPTVRAIAIVGLTGWLFVPW